MFDLLKKKLAGFAEKVKQVIAKKEEAVAKAPEKEVVSKPAKEKAEIVEKAAEKKKVEIAEEAKPVKELLQKIAPLKEEKKRELKAKVGITKQIAAFVTRKIKIEDKDIADLLEELELSLLEADVEQHTAHEIVENVHHDLVGKEIGTKEDVTAYLRKEIKSILQKIMHTEKKVDLEELMKKKKPVVILFLGPNGAGKTTSIAKLTYAMQRRGKKVVFAAADTFRAASIEQLEKHGEKLGVRVVKHKYGADPAAVAFDAVKAAQAAHADLVFIDSAGRQETNYNLMEELKKIDRVIKPDLKLYVGEAYAGQALLQQASEFDSALKLDGFILTKIDADAKGGTAISLLHVLKKPIVYIGVGQNYEDLLEFRPEYILERVIGS